MNDNKAILKAFGSEVGRMRDSCISTIVKHFEWASRRGLLEVKTESRADAAEYIAIDITDSLIHNLLYVLSSDCRYRIIDSETSGAVDIADLVDSLAMEYVGSRGWAGRYSAFPPSK